MPAKSITASRVSSTTERGRTAGPAKKLCARAIEVILSEFFIEEQREVKHLL
jgi:hypothetical protein